MPAKFKELSGLNDLSCFKRYPRRLAKNVVDTRWVTTWKNVDGKIIIKCRITMRGFRDKEITIETFAGTASRRGQRIVNSIVAQNEDFILFSYDVSQAFAKGMTFEEYARATGEQLREVEFEVTAEDAELIRKLPGFEDFDYKTEVLKMLKAIYGLKDAPRAWRKRLHEVLCGWNMSQLQAEPEIYVVHRAIKDAMKSTTTDMDIVPNRFPKLTAIISAHVDDLKGGATPADAKLFLEYLESKFGKCSADYQKFTHTGIEHEQKDDGILTHQFKYIDTLAPLDPSGLRGNVEE